MILNGLFISEFQYMHEKLLGFNSFTWSVLIPITVYVFLINNENNLLLFLLQSFQLITLQC